VSTVEGDKASATMIADLAVSVEETYGVVATRLCRALHSKSSFERKKKAKLFLSFLFFLKLDLSRHRFRYMFCMPAFIIVIIQIALVLSLIILGLINGIPSVHRSINMTYVTLSSILGGSIVISCATWLRLLIGLMKSPKRKIMKYSDRSSRLNENSIYRLKKEVSQLSYIIKSVEAFLNINTRLVVLIDGLDVCEQQRIFQILDVKKIILIDFH